MPILQGHYHDVIFYTIIFFLGLVILQIKAGIIQFWSEQLHQNFLFTN